MFSHGGSEEFANRNDLELLLSIVTCRRVSDTELLDGLIYNCFHTTFVFVCL